MSVPAHRRDDRLYRFVTESASFMEMCAIATTAFVLAPRQVALAPTKEGCFPMA